MCESYTNPDTGGIDSHLDVTPNSVPFGVHTGVILGALAGTYLKPRDGLVNIDGGLAVQ